MPELQIAKWSMELAWKEGLSVDLNAVETWLKANAGEHYCGNSADSSLRVHFLEEPSGAVKDAVTAYWDGIDEESAEVTSYMSQEERAEALAAVKASAKTKLIAGTPLTEEEANALVG